MSDRATFLRLLHEYQKATNIEEISTIENEIVQLFDVIRDEAYAYIKSSEERAAALEKVIQGMFPLWLAAMGYCEHNRFNDLMAMQNYYNGKDNPMTSKDIHLMFSLVDRKENKTRQSVNH